MATVNKKEALEMALKELRESKQNNSHQMKIVQIDRAKAYIRLAESLEGVVRNIQEPTP